MTITEKPDASEQDNIKFVSFNGVSAQRKGLILHDETGQPWVVTVRPDGQLQTAQCPDGEPRTMQMWANKAIIDALEPVGDSGLKLDVADDA